MLFATDIGYALLRSNNASFTQNVFTGLIQDERCNRASVKDGYPVLGRSSCLNHQTLPFATGLYSRHACCVQPSSAKFWLGTLWSNMSNKRLFRGRGLSSGLHPGDGCCVRIRYQDPKRDVRDISDHKYHVNVSPIRCVSTL